LIVAHKKRPVLIESGAFFYGRQNNLVVRELAPAGLRSGPKILPTAKIL
jgi:hypothetical protein